MIKIDSFGGEAPLFPKEALQLPYAAFAKGCVFDSGELRGFGAPIKRGNHIVPASAKTLSLYKPQDIEYLLTFPVRTDVIHNAHAGDQWRRVYWFSENHAPRYGDSTAVLSGLGPFPGSYYELGVPAPVSQPVIEIIPAKDAEGNVIDHVALGHDPIYRSFTYTYVTDFGEESGPWLPADGSAVPQHKMYEGDVVKITDMAPLTGNHPAANGKINVYQTDLAGGFLRVKVLPMSESSTEFVNTAVTGPIIRTALTMPPVAGMKGACLTSYGYMVGFKDSTVYLSDTYLYHSWPSTYAKPCKHKILRVFPSSQGAFVLTEGGPYLLIGTDPANTQLVQIETDEVCTSASACCDLGGAVAFVSANGLCMLSASGVQLLTEAIFDHLSWSALSLDNCSLVRHMGRILLNTGDGGYLFSSGGPRSMWVRHDLRIRVAVTDFSGGEALYAVTGSTDLMGFDLNAASFLPYEWHSPDIVLKGPVPFTCWRLFAKEYSNLLFRVEADGVVIRDWMQVPLDVAKNGYVYGRLKPYRNSRTIVVKFKGTSKLLSFVLAPSFEAMRDE